MIKRLLGTVAAVALTATPTLAATNPAAPLSVSKSVRAGTPTAKKSRLAGSGFIIAAIAVVAVVAGVVIIADSDDDSDSD